MQMTVKDLREALEDARDADPVEFATLLEQEEGDDSVPLLMRFNVTCFGIRRDGTVVLSDEEEAIS
jgi:hypothetical protein